MTTLRETTDETTWRPVDLSRRDKLREAALALIPLTTLSAYHLPLIGQWEMTSYLSYPGASGMLAAHGHSPQEAMEELGAWAEQLDAISIDRRDNYPGKGQTHLSVTGQSGGVSVCIWTVVQSAETPEESA